MNDTKRPSWLQTIQDRLNNHIETSQRQSERQNQILGDLFQVVDNNVSALKQANPRADLEGTPQFLRNHVQENQLSETTIAKIAQEKVATPTAPQVQKQAQASASANAEAQPEKKLLEKKRVRTLVPTLQERVFGQDMVLEEMVDVLKVAALNVKVNKAKPAGCYMFAGPSGVGKTELAQALADALGVGLLKVNMGEYGLEQDVTKLIGTSAGYVGFEQGGLLTNYVKENKTCVVLLDELEKAHTSVDKILLSIMDHGICTDNTGNEVVFKETIVICTSNLGAEVEYETELSKEEKDALRMDYIKAGLRPEIINRFDSIFQFNSLDKDIYKKVVNKFLNILDNNMKEEHEFSLKFSPKLVDFIVEKSYDPAMGGRPARKFIEKVVIKPLADYMLDEDFEKTAKDHQEITMDLNAKEQICFKGKNRKILGVLENTADLVARIEGGKFTNKKALKM